MLSLRNVTVITATSVETKAARRALPGVTVVEAGIGLKKVRDGFGDAIISCGLAGGLHHHLPTGTVLVPYEVLRPDGTTLQCDRELTQSLIAAARNGGLNPVTDPLVTTTAVVTGKERRVWAERGYAGVDMETGLLQAPRVAAVRVVLDTPLCELSEDWLHPVTAALKPWNWAQLVWLAREGPRCARLAARVVAGAFGED